MDERGVFELEGVAPAFALGLGEQGGDERKHRNEKADLEDRERLAEPFDDGVATRVDRIGDDCVEHADLHCTSGN